MVKSRADIRSITPLLIWIPGAIAIAVIQSTAVTAFTSPVVETYAYDAADAKFGTDKSVIAKSAKVAAASFRVLIVFVIVLILLFLIAMRCVELIALQRFR